MINDKLIKENFVTHNVAKKLKAIGFDDECIAWYDVNGEFNLSSYEGISKLSIKLAPTYIQLFNWFKVNFRILIHSDFHVNPFGEDFIPEDWDYKAHYRNKFEENKWRTITSNNIHFIVGECLDLLEQQKLI
jgi:hypothetical protein